MKDSWIVVGGGMRGLTAAIALRRLGKDVTVLEGQALPGGIMCPLEWDDLYVDRGCHMFDAGHGPSAQLYYDILKENFVPLDIRYASINKGLKSDGIAVPDMSLFSGEDRKQAVEEVTECAKRDDTNTAETFEQFLKKRYGAHIAEYLDSCGRKLFGYDTGELERSAALTVPMFSRVRIGSDDEMRALKVEPALDDRLAASSQTDPMRYYQNEAIGEHRHIYPSQQGMHGWCVAAKAYIEELGIQLLTGKKLEQLQVDDKGHITATCEDGSRLSAAKCYWALPSGLFAKLQNIDDPTKSFAKPVGFLIYHFRVKPENVGAYTYIHDYSNDTICFRSSCPGVYGNQLDANGMTYVTAEVPTPPGSDLWNSADTLPTRLWSELQCMGQVKKGTEIDRVFMDKVPVAYMLPGLGWGAARRNLYDLLTPFTQSVVFSDGKPLAKTDIVNAVAEDIREHL